MTRAVLLLLALALAPVAAAQRPLRAKLRFRPDGKEPRYIQLGINGRTRKAVSDGCALTVRGRPLAPRVVGEATVDIAGESVKVGELHGLRVDCAGKTIPYALRVVNGEWNKPALMTAGAMVGSLGGLSIALIDANMNGRYDDIGEDRMALGRSQHAFPLSSLVLAGKRVLRLEFAPSGSTVTATAEAPAMGLLDFRSMYEGPLKPEVLVFRRDGERGVEHVLVDGRAGEARLPRGIWRLAYGVLSRDVWLEGTKESTVDLQAAVGLLKWGAPYGLAPQTRTALEGRLRTFKPPGHLRAPQLLERVVRGKWLIMNWPPAVRGRAGERYIGPWTRADRMGTSLADPSVGRFDVELRHEGQPINGEMREWKPWDMSGLVQKVRPYWLSYEYRLKAVPPKAALQLIVTCESRLFGKLTSGPVAVQAP